MTSDAGCRGFDKVRPRGNFTTGSMYGRDVMGQEAAGFAWTTPTTSCSLPAVWGMRRQS